MAHGNPDYWGIETLGLPVPGIDQVLWRNTKALAIAAGANAFGVDYIVPADEVLFVTGIAVSARNPGTNFARLYLGGVVQLNIHFDTFEYLPLSPSAILQVNATQTVNMRMYNYDIMLQTLYFTLTGIRITIVPGTPTPAGIGIAVDGAGI